MSGLENITDQGTLGKCISGMVYSDFDRVPDVKKIETLMNIINASVVSGIELSSSQVKYAFLKS